MVEDIAQTDFTHYETGVSVQGLNYNAYARAIHEECLKKTAHNLGVTFQPGHFVRCKTCVYDTRMPGIYLYSDERCNMCHRYETAKDEADEAATLKNELAACLERSPKAGCDIVIGLSGGKDSASILSYLTLERGLHVHAVLVDNGFIPSFVRDNCQDMCDAVGAKFVVLEFDFRKQVKSVIKAAQPEMYPCYLCSKKFTQYIANYAADIGCLRVALGRNFWASIEPTLSGVKEVAAQSSERVAFYSVPFLLGWKIEDLFDRLERVGWNKGNEGIPGLSTNCTVPGLVESTFINATGVHPETPLIANEVITGFVSREEGLRELGSSGDDIDSLLD